MCRAATAMSSPPCCCARDTALPVANSWPAHKSKRKLGQKANTFMRPCWRSSWLAISFFFLFFFEVSPPIPLLSSFYSTLLISGPSTDTDATIRAASRQEGMVHRHLAQLPDGSPDGPNPFTSRKKIVRFEMADLPGFSRTKKTPSLCIYSVT
ncbi:hypothetical protein LZ30DRAFT_190807 [Colletotrichum cereale]|nr:hypothetical protein LZ30DRAFT_190807 [Colletotrichum cereale]